MAKTISLLAGRMPERLTLHYTCSVLRSRNSRKAFKFLSKRVVLLLYGNQYRNLCFVHKTAYLSSMRSPGGGELSLSACLGLGIDRQVRTQIPGDMHGGGGDGNR